MKDSFILGVAMPGEASETMVELCLRTSIVLLRKLAIYCNYIWYILTQKMGGNKFACVSGFWMCGVTKSQWNENNLQKTPSEKSGVVLSSAYL
jgi:hypothetical protein